MCGSASASTRRPRSRAVVRRDRADRHDDRLRVGNRADAGRRSSSTVDDDVNVIASTSPARTRASVVGVGLGAAPCGRRGARRPRSRVARAPRAARRAPARRGRAAPARRRASGSGTPRAATRRRSARARGRRGCRARRSARCGAGPDRGDPHARERARVEARAASRPRSKNASTPFADVNTSHAYVGEIGERERRRGSIAIVGSSITSAPSASSRARSSLACSRARVTTTVRPKSGRRSNHARSSAATVADDDRARRVARRRRRSSRAWPAPCAARAGCRSAPRRPACRGASPPSIRRCGDRRRAARAHEDHERAAGAGERVPVDVGAALRRVLVAGDDGEVRRQPAVRDRDARRRRARRSRS